MKIKKAFQLTYVLTVLVLFSINNLYASPGEIQHKKTIIVNLNSMQCNMCVEKITKAINTVEGVSKVKINLDKKTATVTFNSDKTNKEEIENAITSAGYDANDKLADPNAYEKLSSCCKKQ